ncbi:MAG: hypothetical protein RBR30_14255 [Tenuifilaceae bacterium]|nr:hypothetical protein [Tenuifilaceae bacterium]
MIALMNQLLESLRQRVIDNLATIRANEKEIRKILAEPLSNQRSYNLTNRQSLSKKILSENAENLKIQNLIVAFMRTYKDIPAYPQLLDSINSFESGLATNNSKSEYDTKSRNSEIAKLQTPKPTEPAAGNEKEQSSKVFNHPVTTNEFTEKVKQSLFEITATGKLAFNKTHPKFGDQDFFDQLLDYHTQREEYEICAKLMKTRQ